MKKKKGLKIFCSHRTIEMEQEYSDWANNSKITITGTHLGIGYREYDASNKIPSGPVAILFVFYEEDTE
jgi:hypothetical protein